MSAQAIGTDESVAEWLAAAEARLIASLDAVTAATAEVAAVKAGPHGERAERVSRRVAGGHVRRALAAQRQQRADARVDWSHPRNWNTH